MDEPLLFFDAENVSDLTGLSTRQIRQWDKAGIFHPQFTSSRLYSLRDVVGLRALAQVRGRVAPEELRKLATWLKERQETPWARLCFSQVGRKVLFQNPATDEDDAAPTSAQAVDKIALGPIAREIAATVERMREREPHEIGRVVRHRRVMGNAPVLAGTRIPTSTIWSFHTGRLRYAGYPRAVSTTD